MSKITDEELTQLKYYNEGDLGRYLKQLKEKYGNVTIDFNDGTYTIN
jgi:hypothetical protein